MFTASHKGIITVKIALDFYSRVVADQKLVGLLEHWVCYARVVRCS